MPRKPSNFKEVRWAAGQTHTYRNTQTGESVGPFSILHEKDDDGSRWISICLEHYFHMESAPGETLAVVHKRITDHICELLNTQMLHDLPRAPEEEWALFAEINAVGKTSSDFGHPDMVNQAIKASHASQARIEPPATFVEDVTDGLALAA